MIRSWPRSSSLGGTGRVGPCSCSSPSRCSHTGRGDEQLRAGHSGVIGSQGQTRWHRHVHAVLRFAQDGCTGHVQPLLQSRGHAGCSQVRIQLHKRWVGREATGEATATENERPESTRKYLEAKGHSVCNLLSSGSEIIIYRGAERVGGQMIKQMWQFTIGASR